MNDPNSRLTDYVLRLPRVLAMEYAEPGTTLYDELVSEGNVRLTVCARRYDPGYRTQDGKSVLFITYAYNSVKSFLKGYKARHVERSMKTEQFEADPCEEVYDDCDRERHDEVLDARSECEEVLSRLDPQERAIVRAKYFEGRTNKDVADSFGIRVEDFRARLTAIEDKMRGPVTA